ncbi:MAG: hypothetical protein COA33_014385, partial [Fluviicola sp.]|nr:hypothetical protein [Fluviicola sp.]
MSWIVIFTFPEHLGHHEPRFTPLGLPIFKPSNIWNQEPLLKDIPMNDFHFWSTSPLIDAGSSSFP